MNSPTAKVSVIIPCYNMSGYLEQCLQCVQQQTLCELEIICINDGSTDETEAILRQYAANDPRIRIISRENKGVGMSRNEGVQAACGEYVAFLDPDDLYPSPHTLELLYTKAAENGAAICGGSLCWFCNDLQRTVRDFGYTQQPSILTHEGYISYADYQYEYGFYRFIYRRSMLQENNIVFPSYPRFQDPPFMVRAMLCAGRFYAIPETTYAYRRSHKQVEWERSLVDGFMAGVNDVWQLANEHQLSRLKRYLRWHIAEHYPEVVHLLTPPHLDLLEQIDEDARLKSMTIWRSIFSKHKHFANRKCRKFTILGRTLTLYKS